MAPLNQRARTAPAAATRPMSKVPSDDFGGADADRAKIVMPGVRA
jgi:hypothetical protein